MDNDKELFQVEIDKTLKRLWKAKYRRRQAKEIERVMRKDLGLCDDMIDKELEDIRIKKHHLVQREKELIDAKENHKKQRSIELRSHYDNIKELFPKLPGKSWKNNHDICDKLAKFGIEATKNEVYELLNGDK